MKCKHGTILYGKRCITCEREQEIAEAEVEMEEILESGDLEDQLDAAFKLDDLKRKPRNTTP